VKRILFSLAISGLLAAPAYGSAGFSCQSEEADSLKLEVGGATPRSGSTLINFGGTLELEGRKIELAKSDAKSFAWRRGGLRLLVRTQVDGQTYTLRVDAKSNPKDEDDWSGTYEWTVPGGKPDKSAKAKAKMSVKRGNVKCFVE